MSIKTAHRPAPQGRPLDEPTPERGPPVWPHAANAVLGVWLATAATAYSPRSGPLVWSDVASGGLIVLLSAMACSIRFHWAAWAVAGVGLWLMCAPLVFWAPTAAAYGTDTLIGTLVVMFAILVPGTVGTKDLPGPDVPPGWSYNPSAWPQRAGIVALALVQFFAARHLATFQLDHIDSVWDPFFGEGTRRVLESDVSQAFPVSDAGLGAVTYLIEALTGCLGGTRRWRTMPWAVLLFGVLIVPVGVVSIVLVVLQPLAVGAWCSLCLLTAALTLLMISPAVDEVVATSQFLRRARREGGSLWRAFWKGGTDEREPAERVETRESLIHRLAAGMELNSIPWNLAVCAVLGIWLMVAPGVLETQGAAASSDLLTGALIVTFAVIGFGEAARAARWINIGLAAWLVVAPWVLSGSTWSSWNDVVVGVAVLALTFRRGPIRSRFGSWDRWVI